MKFEIKTEWSGYSRGVATYIVEADDKEEAEEIWYDGEEVSRTTVRDDRETEVQSVVEL